MELLFLSQKHMATYVQKKVHTQQVNKGLMVGICYKAITKLLQSCQ